MYKVSIKKVILLLIFIIVLLFTGIVLSGCGSKDQQPPILIYGDVSVLSHVHNITYNPWREAEHNNSFVLRIEGDVDKVYYTQVLVSEFYVHYEENYIDTVVSNEFYLQKKDGKYSFSTTVFDRSWQAPIWYTTVILHTVSYLGVEKTYELLYVGG